MNLDNIHRCEGLFGTEFYVLDEKSGGFTAFFKDFPDIVTQGETIPEAQKNLWNIAYDVFRWHHNSFKKKIKTDATGKADPDVLGSYSGCSDLEP